jgi:medium-chain acyl-[acyl-carrier-protein] hydrolase
LKNLTKSLPVYSQKINFPYSAMGSLGQFRIDKILTLFQDLAFQHSAFSGITGFDLAQKGLMWVISRYQLDIHRHPQFSETLELRTDRSTLKNLYEVKSFTIRDMDGHELVTARGVWIMVKQSNSKPVRLDTFMPDSLLNGKNEDTFSGLFNAVESFNKVDFETTFRIRFHDLDMNRHVNNTIYVQWALNSMPTELIFKYIPDQCFIQFHKESFYPGHICSKTKVNVLESGLTSWHSIENMESGYKLSSIKIFWTKAEHP